MSATYYRYRSKDGTRMALFKIAAGGVNSIPFEHKEKLNLKVTPEGHVLIARPGPPKEMAPEDVLIRLQESITRLKEEMHHVQNRAYAAGKECLASVWPSVRNFDTDAALYDAALNLSKFEALGEIIEKSEWKGREDVVGRARAGHLALKPFYLKWKKLAAEKETLEKDYGKRAALL